jgi:hypothetical protein
MTFLLLDLVHRQVCTMGSTGTDVLLLGFNIRLKNQFGS